MVRTSLGTTALGHTSAGSAREALCKLPMRTIVPELVFPEHRASLLKFFWNVAFMKQLWLIKCCKKQSFSANTANCTLGKSFSTL